MSDARRRSSSSTHVGGSPPFFSRCHVYGATKNRSGAGTPRDGQEARERRLCALHFGTGSVHSCPSLASALACAHGDWHEREQTATRIWSGVCSRAPDQPPRPKARNPRWRTHERRPRLVDPARRLMGRDAGPCDVRTLTSPAGDMARRRLLSDEW